MNLHNVFICLSFYQLTILCCLLFSVFLILHSTDMLTTAYHWILLSACWILRLTSHLCLSLKFTYIQVSQTIFYEFFTNKIWLKVQILTQYSIKFSHSSCYFPTTITDIYPTSSSTSHSYITLHHRTNILKNPVLRERAWQRLKWE